MEKDIYFINENKLTYGRGYVYSLQYHIVWCTKYRRKVLTGGADELYAEGGVRHETDVHIFCQDQPLR